ncbi:hypothetical protein C8Q79DRAFT_940847 [Trametes meyenii]|nr:hypothetical protein C8Q79DRAFT_940847 [Trametes meyenii]
MPSRGKKQRGNIVVRAIAHGEHRATKTVFGTLSQLNHRAPLEKLDPVDFQLYKNYKPWKKASHADPCKAHGPRRNPGRNDGQTYMSGSFVCGVAVDPILDPNDYDDTELEWASEYADDVNVDEDVRWATLSQATQEVHIMDIAKPMKPKGAARKFEIIDTVQRVIALDEDNMADWTGRIGGDSELDEWETLEAEDMCDGEVAASYATVLRQR